MFPRVAFEFLIDRVFPDTVIPCMNHQKKAHEFVKVTAVAFRAKADFHRSPVVCVESSLQIMLQPHKNEVTNQVCLGKRFPRRVHALKNHLRVINTLLQPDIHDHQLLNAFVDNIQIRAALENLPAEVKGGRPLSQIMAKDPLFTPLVVQMVRVGEESGRLGNMLLELAGIYDADVEASIKRILSLIEPALILVMGLVISLLIISILMGILAVNDLAI